MERRHSQAAGPIVESRPMNSSRRLRVLKHEDYLQLRAGARVVEADHYGEKVLILADGTYLKLFRRKRLISSAAWYPYARRFADNADALAQLGIPCPQVIETYRLPEIARDAVHYRALPGETLRHAVARGLGDDEANRLRRQFREFVGRLHDLGIYFRSCHLGNVVVTPNGEMGLIDIADLQLGGRSLRPAKRRRNYSHILRYTGDRDWLLAGVEWQELQKQL